MLLSPSIVRSAPMPCTHELRFDLHPLQAGMQRSPWHVCIITMLMESVHHEDRVRAIVPELFNLYPNPLMLALADEYELQDMLQSLGMYRTLIRRLQRVSWKWDASGWEDLRELPGVNQRVADAIIMFCFEEPCKTPTSLTQSSGGQD